MMSAPKAIEIHRVSKVYNESQRQHVILEDVKFDIQPGEFIVLLGRSGSGKSTLLNLIGGIDLPSAGEIRVNGINVTGLTERQRTLFRRLHIGFVFQSYNLLPTLTVIENLLLPLQLIKPLTPRDRQQSVALLHRLGLADRIDSYPDRLSGGEQQRVAIGRALVHQPDLILADEPTGNLDLETAQQVTALLDNLVRKAGKTMILATHSREVMGLADRVFSIRNRCLLEIDKTT